MKKIILFSILFLSLTVNAQTDTSSLKCDCFIIKNEEVDVTIQDNRYLGMSRETNYCIFNVMGLLILYGCGTQIDMNIFPSGIYFVTINGQTLKVKTN